MPARLRPISELLERTSDSYPGAVSIPLAVLAGIGCAAILDRVRSADLLLDTFFTLGLTPEEKNDLAEYLKSLPSAD